MATEAVVPSSKHQISISRELLKDIKTLGAIDRGGTLTKLVYVAKSNPTNKKGDCYQLTCVTFDNKHFEQSIDYMKKEALLPDKGQIRVTGFGGHTYRRIIQSKLGLEPVFLDEFIAQGRGVHLLITNGVEDQIFHPTPKVKYPEIQMPPALQAFAEDMKSKVGEDAGLVPTCGPNKKGKFPCIYAFMGSGAGQMFIDEKGRLKLVGQLGISGKTLLGLSKLILGTSSYTKLSELADTGYRGNVDNQCSDLIEDDENSPYGRFPADMPIFGFGKVYDRDQGIDSFSKNDVANSLVGLAMQDALGHLTLGCMANGANKIYVGGNMMQAEVYRREMEKLLPMHAHGMLEVKYLKTGHTAAIGALVTAPEDAMKYFLAG